MGKSYLERSHFRVPFDCQVQVRDGGMGSQPCGPGPSARSEGSNQVGLSRLQIYAVPNRRVYHLWPVA